MRFSKLQGAGNDFILFDYIDIEEKLKSGESYSEIAKQVCDRHFGIGADGIMVSEKSEIADIKMVYYNSDGSKGEMCGNGIRCFSRFVFENNIVKKNKFVVETEAGLKNIDIEIKGEKIKFIRVDMGKIEFCSEKIPCSVEKNVVLEEKIEIDGLELKFSSVLMGVPHTVIFLNSFDEIDWKKIGEKIEKNTEIFPKKTNVNFVRVVDDTRLEIRTWERGAGHTLACGTGSCSAVAIGKKLGKILGNKIEVQTEGDKLIIDIDDDYNIFMSGRAKLICIGEFIKED